MVIGALVIGTAAGSYPAILMAAFHPVTVLKGRLSSNIMGRRFRDILVVFQFCVSVILLVGTAVIYTQLHYLRNKELGFDKEHVVVIHRAEKLGTKQLAFKDQLRLNPEILNATFTGHTGLLAHFTAKDKISTSELLTRTGVPVARLCVAGDFEAAEKAAAQLGWPVVVKPPNQDLSVGVVTGIRTAEALRTRLASG